MDLAKLDASSPEGAVMEVRHPGTGLPLKTEDGKPITITLVGTDSPRYRARRKVIADRNLNQRARGKLTADSLEDDVTSLFVAATLGWSNIEIDGAPVEFNRENAATLYTRLPWLREQIDQFIEDRANFLKASSAT